MSISVCWALLAAIYGMLPCSIQGEDNQRESHPRSNSTKEAIKPNAEEKMGRNVLEITRGGEHSRLLVDEAGIDRVFTARLLTDFLSKYSHIP